jgi:hypothetical protein
MITFRPRVAVWEMLAVLLICVLLIGCESDPVSPDPTPECERLGTAEVVFLNRSAHSTYDVILDGSRIGSIAPNHSIMRVVAAGQHSHQFFFSNTGQPACSVAYPNVAACQRMTFSCSSDH